MPKRYHKFMEVQQDGLVEGGLVRYDGYSLSSPSKNVPILDDDGNLLIQGHLFQSNNVATSVNPGVLVTFQIAIDACGSSINLGAIAIIKYAVRFFVGLKTNSGGSNQVFLFERSIHLNGFLHSLLWQ